ncbi:hydrogenase nickel incorporation protein HypB [Aurantivibrio infirmus]
MCTICGCDSLTKHQYVNKRSDASKNSLHPNNTWQPAIDIITTQKPPRYLASNDNAKDIPVLNFGDNAAGVTVAGCESTRLVNLQKSLFAKNNTFAQQAREHLKTQHCLGLNLLSSPGTGKTTLLAETLSRLVKTLPCSVIEGDQQTTLDADRLAATGAQTLQINTGKGCHLDAHMMIQAFDRIPAPKSGVVFIENVGNLVCPAGFDLGEHHKIVALSVTEGEDKPLKYPDAFYHSSLLLITKTDLLPYVDFDISKCRQYAQEINPAIKIIEVSAKTGQGMGDWLNWLYEQISEMTSENQ